MTLLSLTVFHLIYLQSVEVYIYIAFAIWPTESDVCLPGLFCRY